jgi:hypothetical protein
MLHIFWEETMLRGKLSGALLTVGAAILMLGGFPLLAQAQPVHFKELMAILAIDPPKDWKVSEKPKGTTLKSPVQMSEAEVEFRSGDQKKIEIKIVDGLGGMLPFVRMAQGMEMESSEEYMKPIEVQGFKGTENFKYKDKKGEITLPVANRFLVTIEGRGMDNTEVMKEVAGKLDLKKLAGLAK